MQEKELNQNNKLSNDLIFFNKSSVDRNKDSYFYIVLFLLFTIIVSVVHIHFSNSVFQSIQGIMVSLGLIGIPIGLMSLIFSFIFKKNIKNNNIIQNFFI